MLINNEYNLVYNKKRNQIVISLPQTWNTLTNTLEPVTDRRADVDEKDLAVLLTVTRAIFATGTEDADVMKYFLNKTKVSSLYGEMKEDAER